MVELREQRLALLCESDIVTETALHKVVPLRSAIPADSDEVERLARQFEHLSHKPPGWMDVPHTSPASSAAAAGAVPADAMQLHRAPQSSDETSPQDDDERFIVGLVLTYYRRHPQRARTRLLDLLGEVLTPPPAAPGPTGPAFSHQLTVPPLTLPSGASVQARSVWRR